MTVRGLTLLRTWSWALVVLGVLDPSAAAAQASPPVRACDPPYHNLPFSSERGLKGKIDTREDFADATVSRLSAQVTTQAAVVPLLDLARCYYLVNQLNEAVATLERAVLLMGDLDPEPGAVPDTWAAMPLAGRDLPSPRKTRDRAAEMNNLAFEVGIRGVVIVDAVIDKAGRVRDARIASSIPAHDAAALAAVNAWRFAPTVVDGTPVDVAAILLVAFGDVVRTVENLDVARLYVTRGHPDALGWAVTALRLLEEERQAWSADSKGYPNENDNDKGLITEPLKIAHVPPKFPRIALAEGQMGVVVVEAIIDATGRVKYARVQSGPTLLREAALTAVRQWLYTPARVDGRIVEVLMTVTVNFSR